MKNIAALLLITILWGCAANHPGIQVHNLKTGEEFLLSGNSGSYDELVPTSIDSQFIYAMYKESDHLALVKHNLSGNIIKKTSLPLPSAYYGAMPFSLSPDENTVAYSKERDIYLYNIPSGQEKTLIKDAVSNKFNIKGVLWADNENLIIILDDDSNRGKSGEILKFNITSNKISNKLPIKSPSNYSFSKKTGWLAITQMKRGSGIKIVDTRNLTVMSEIQNPNEQTWMNSPSWDASGTKLLAVINDTLNYYDLKNPSANTTLFNLPKGSVTYFTAFVNDTVFAIKYAQGGGGSNDLFFIDMRTKETIKKFSDVWGGIAFVDDGNVIAYVKH